MAELKTHCSVPSGKSCLYIRQLDDVDLDVLRELLTRSVALVRKNSK